MLTVPILSWFPPTSCPAVPDLYSPAAQSTPCPNAECWDYDKSTSSCTLKENSNCFETDCQATKMIIKFKSTVYGIVDGQSDAFQSYGVCKPVWDAVQLKWVFEANLGDCGLLLGSEVHNSIDYITFSTSFIEYPTRVNLDGVMANIKLSSEVNFSCRYNANVDVNPGNLKVNNVAGGVAKDTVIGYGSLGGAFQINFYEDDQFITALANQAFLGQTVYTSVDFTQTGLETQLKFYIDNCSIKQESVSVNVIEDNCYASGLSVKKISTDKIQPRSSRFSFVAFLTQDSQMQESSMLQCNVNLCVVADNNCVINTVDSECPNEINYKYTVNGSN